MDGSSHLPYRLTPGSDRSYSVTPPWSDNAKLEPPCFPQINSGYWQSNLKESTSHQNSNYFVYSCKNMFHARDEAVVITREEKLMWEEFLVFHLCGNKIIPSLPSPDTSIVWLSKYFKEHVIHPKRGLLTLPPYFWISHFHIYCISVKTEMDEHKSPWNATLILSNVLPRPTLPSLE